MTDALTHTSTGAFSSTVSGLSISLQSYEFRAVVDTSDGDSNTGTTASFDTSSIASVESITDVTRESATFRGSVDLDDPTTIDASFEYRKVPTEQWMTTESGAPSSDGSTIRTVSGLVSRRYYEVRLVVESGDETAVSSVDVFDTPNPATGGGSSGDLSGTSHFAPGDGLPMPLRGSTTVRPSSRSPNPRAGCLNGQTSTASGWWYSRPARRSIWMGTSRFATIECTSPDKRRSRPASPSSAMDSTWTRATVSFSTSARAPVAPGEPTTGSPAPLFTRLRRPLRVRPAPPDVRLRRVVAAVAEQLPRTRRRRRHGPRRAGVGVRHRLGVRRREPRRRLNRPPLRQRDAGSSSSRVSDQMTAASRVRPWPSYRP